MRLSHKYRIVFRSIFLQHLTSEYVPFWTLKILYILIASAASPLSWKYRMPLALVARSVSGMQDHDS